jgi:hypothetical protein
VIKSGRGGRTPDLFREDVPIEAATGVHIRVAA